MKFPSLAQIRKLVVFVLGVVAGLVSIGLLHGTALAVAGAVITAATGAGIFAVPNEPAAGGSKPAG